MSFGNGSRTKFKWKNNIDKCVKLLDNVRESSYEGSLLRASIDRWSAPVGIALPLDEI